MTTLNRDKCPDKYVAFVDLLGFKTLVSLAETDSATLVHMRELLRLVRDTLCNIPTLNARLTYASDSLFFSVERSEAGLREMFESLELLTSNLLQHNILVRGGLAAGWCEHDKDFIFGTAVSRAVSAERTQRNPMIVTCAAVAADAEKYGEYYHRWLLRDAASQCYFFNFLRYYAEYRPTPIYAGMVIRDEPAKRLIDFICHRLVTDKDDVLAKAKWLQAYWNTTVAVHGVFEAIGDGVKNRYPSSGPTIGMRRVVAGRTPQQ